MVEIESHDRLRLTGEETEPTLTSGANLTFESRLRLGSCSNVKFKSSTRLK